MRRVTELTPLAGTDPTIMVLVSTSPPDLFPSNEAALVFSAVFGCGQ